MGECGCRPDPIAKFPAPGGWYVVEVHPGCNYCGTEWGLGVSRVRPGSEWYDLGRIPEARFFEIDGDLRWGTLILDTGALRREFARDDPDEFSDANMALDEFVSGEGLRRVYHATRSARP